jgi:anthranilate phosphoribosyltransferase
VLATFSSQLADSKPLTDEQILTAVEQLIHPEISVTIKATFLTMLATKGETVQEIAAFVRALRARAIVPPLDPTRRPSRDILDVCGTGGDRLNTFNISTTVALICAAAGVPVAKHGNRAVTSQAGSADVLEALGIEIDLSPAQAAQSLQERNFAFFFAPNYHPAFKFISPARKLCAERGQRTIFNFLGPLLNPARPTTQLVGVPEPALCEPMAQVLQSIGVRRGMVVCGNTTRQDTNSPAPDLNGSAYLDELSILGDNTIAEFYQERGMTSSVSALGVFPPSSLADLQGGDREHNALIVKSLLEGKDQGPKRDAIILNASAALFVAGRSRSLSDAKELSETVIDSGAALRKLDELSKG